MYNPSVTRQYIILGFHGFYARTVCPWEAILDEVILKSLIDPADFDYLFPKSRKYFIGKFFSTEEDVICVIKKQF